MESLMGHSEERVPMESVIDLEGTAPPSELLVGQPETIQEEKEEEIPVTSQIMEGNEMEGGESPGGVDGREEDEGEPGYQEDTTHLE